MLWLLGPRPKPLLSVPSSRASVHRPHQLPPPCHNLTPPDWGPYPVPPMPSLTLPAFVARSRRPSLGALASTPYHPTLSHSQQQLLPLLPSPSPLSPRGGGALPLLRQGLSRWPSPFLSAPTAAIVHAQQVVSIVVVITDLLLYISYILVSPSFHFLSPFHSILQLPHFSLTPLFPSF
jgi:hypothetical protein